MGAFDNRTAWRLCLLEDCMAPGDSLTDEVTPAHMQMWHMLRLWIFNEQQSMQIHGSGAPVPNNGLGHFARPESQLGWSHITFKPKLDTGENRISEFLSWSPLHKHDLIYKKARNNCYQPIIHSVTSNNVIIHCRLVENVMLQFCWDVKWSVIHILKSRGTHIVYCGLILHALVMIANKTIPMWNKAFTCIYSMLQHVNWHHSEKFP